MKLHEYQGKQICAKYGIGGPKGRPCFTVGEAGEAAGKMMPWTASSVVVSIEPYATSVASRQGRTTRAL